VNGSAPPTRGSGRFHAKRHHRLPSVLRYERRDVYASRASPPSVVRVALRETAHRPGSAGTERSTDVRHLGSDQCVAHDQVRTARSYGFPGRDRQTRCREPTLGHTEHTRRSVPRVRRLETNRLSQIRFVLRILQRRPLFDILPALKREAFSSILRKFARDGQSVCVMRGFDRETAVGA
jgi:hypothetical protein